MAEGESMRKAECVRVKVKGAAGVRGWSADGSEIRAGTAERQSYGTTERTLCRGRHVALAKASSCRRTLKSPSASFLRAVPRLLSLLRSSAVRRRRRMALSLSLSPFTGRRRRSLLVPAVRQAFSLRRLDDLQRRRCPVWLRRRRSATPEVRRVGFACGEFFRLRRVLFRGLLACPHAPGILGDIGGMGAGWGHPASGKPRRTFLSGGRPSTIVAYLDWNFKTWMGACSPSKPYW